jgi:hypothetical protein
MQATLVLLALLAQATIPATEKEGKSKAQRLLDEGSLLYRKGDYTAALEKFEAAYASFPSPKLWFNIGQASRGLGRPVEALHAFEKFLALATDAPPDTVADAQKTAEELRKRLGQVRIECEPADAELSLDGKILGMSPLPSPVWATPGRHQVTATSAGLSPTLANVEIKAGSTEVVVVRLAAPPATLSSETTPVAPPSSFLSEAPRPPLDREGWLLGRKWTWVAAGSAILFAGSAAIVGGLAVSRLSDLKSTCGSNSPTRPGCNESDISSLQTRMTTANVLWGLAGATAIAAGALFFLEKHPVIVSPLAGETKGLLAEMEF